MALGLAQIILDVRKNLKPTQVYMLNSLGFTMYPKKLVPEDVWAQALKEPFGASHADQGRKSGAHHQFSDP